MVYRADYNRKAEDAVDYEDIDEQYDGPEVQVVSEEDHLLPKKEYFSSAVALGSLNSRTSVFDDDDYDEEEEQEEERAPVEKPFETEEKEPGLLLGIFPFFNKIISTFYSVRLLCLDSQIRLGELFSQKLYLLSLGKLLLAEL